MKICFACGLIVVWLSLPACMQRLDAQTLEFRMRHGQQHPWQSTAFPPEQQIQVNATPDWTARITGQL